MQQFQGRPAARERRADEGRRQDISYRQDSYSDRRITGEPAKFNIRAEHRRISWENDLYERQSQ